MQLIQKCHSSILRKHTKTIIELKRSIMEFGEMGSKNLDEHLEYGYSLGKLERRKIFILRF